MADKTYQPKIYTAQDGEGHFDENVVATTSTSIVNYGLHVMGTTKVVTLDAPVLGARKIIQFNSTKAQAVQCGGTAYINASPNDLLTVTAEAGPSADLGCCITLRGGSTALWYVEAIGWGTTGTSTWVNWTVKLSSA